MIRRAIILLETIKKGFSKEVTFELKPEPSEIVSMHVPQEEHSRKKGEHL